MLGAVNMGRGIGFQRRTGARARQMPGRPLGVRGSSFRLVAMDARAGMSGARPTYWVALHCTVAYKVRLLRPNSSALCTTDVQLLPHAECGGDGGLPARQ